LAELCTQIDPVNLGITHVRLEQEAKTPAARLRASRRQCGAQKVENLVDEHSPAARIAQAESAGEQEAEVRLVHARAHRRGDESQQKPHIEAGSCVRIEAGTVSGQDNPQRGKFL
jgi:hypothetical protein